MSKHRMSDPRGGHVRLYWAITDSPAWRALSFSQQALYVAIRRRLTSNSNGNIEASAAGLRKQGFEIATSSLASGLQALIAVGLIAVTRPGGWVGRGQAIATLYRFTDEPSHEWPTRHIPAYKATDDWRRFATVDEAKAAIATAAAAGKSRHAKARQARATKGATKAEVDSTGKIYRLEKSHRLDSKNKISSTRNSKPETISGAEFRVDSGLHDFAASLIH